MDRVRVGSLPLLVITPPFISREVSPVSVTVPFTVPAFMVNVPAFTVTLPAKEPLFVKTDPAVP